MNDTMTLAERADALEHRMMRELDAIIVKSRLFKLADGDMSIPNGPALLAANPGKHMLMGDDPRLPKMPEKPTLMDFFKYRFGPANHLLQSARHAVRAGMDEKVILACLVHDIGVIGFIRADHGYWGAQMVAPYVDEEVSWAIRAHQALRFYADESVGYSYPESYIKNFGADYRPDPYIEEEYRRARDHKWYMTARMITVNDIYSFDPNAKVELVILAQTSASLFADDYDETVTKRMSTGAGVPAIASAQAVGRALRALRAHRIAIVSPYSDAVNERAARYFGTKHGLETVALEGFGATDSYAIGQLGPENARDAFTRINRPEIEAFVVPGGNFPTMSSVAAWEQEFNKPVVTTNQASFWAMLRAFNAGDRLPTFGRLLAEVPPG